MHIDLAERREGYPASSLRPRKPAARSSLTSCIVSRFSPPLLTLLVSWTKLLPCSEKLLLDLVPSSTTGDPRTQGRCCAQGSQHSILQGLGFLAITLRALLLSSRKEFLHLASWILYSPILPATSSCSFLDPWLLPPHLPNLSTRRRPRGSNLGPPLFSMSHTPWVTSFHAVP